MEPDAFPSNASSCQYVNWNPLSLGREMDACSWHDAGGRTRNYRIREDQISTYPHHEFHDYGRQYLRTCVDGGKSLTQQPGRSEMDIAPSFVGSVHHHYPNHSSVKAIHPNSQIFRPCYPETLYSRCGSIMCDLQPGCASRHRQSPGEGRTGGWRKAHSESFELHKSREKPNSGVAAGGFDETFPSTQKDAVNSPCFWRDVQQPRLTKSNQNRCCANCSSSYDREHSMLTQKSNPAFRVERCGVFGPQHGGSVIDRENFNRVSNFEMAVSQRSDLRFPSEDEFRPDNFEVGEQRREFLPEFSFDARERHMEKCASTGQGLSRRRNANPPQRCCAYHSQNRENHYEVHSQELSNSVERMDMAFPERLSQITCPKNSYGPKDSRQEGSSFSHWPAISSSRHKYSGVKDSHGPAPHTSFSFADTGVLEREIHKFPEGKGQISGEQSHRINEESAGERSFSNCHSFAEKQLAIGGETSSSDDSERSWPLKNLEMNEEAEPQEREGDNTPSIRQVYTDNCDDVQMPLIEEQIRVLLWALLGSERLCSAATSNATSDCLTSDGSSSTCWSRTPVRDLLGAILGVCGCPECRERHSFLDLARRLLNMCPPLSNRLADGGPDSLARVVKSVYHNDLMPSIKRLEADFPDGVRRAMTRVARLEWALNLANPNRKLKPGDQTSETISPLTSMEVQDHSSQVPLPKMAEKSLEKQFVDGNEKQKQSIPKWRESHWKGIEGMKNQPCNGSDRKISQDWLHPHHKFLKEGLCCSLSNYSQMKHPYRHGETHCADRKDSQISQEEQSNPIKNVVIHDVQKQNELPIIRRKRGRPPKLDSEKNNECKTEKNKRMLLWKFLITLLDENQVNMSQAKKCRPNLHPDNKTFGFKYYESLQENQQEKYDKSQYDHDVRENSSSSESSNDLPNKCDPKISSLIPRLGANKGHKTDGDGGAQHESPCLQWICREEGLFRILDTADLAKRWGSQHKNPKMNYEKMSRAMRTYYQRKVLVPVPRSYNLPKKLVYKFNPVILKKIPPPCTAKQIS